MAKKSAKPKTGAKTAPVPVESDEDKLARVTRERMVADSKEWTRTVADELAIQKGYVFDRDRGEYVCRWVEKMCYLYEGIGAGKPLVLMPYQREFIMRLFGWIHYSDEWKEWVRRFRVANLICSKKNGKTPLEAAIGLYLTCADGESGQKVYIAAKNGKQAQLAQGHAIAMVEQSPQLKVDCSVNKSTFTIHHTSTRSRMIILAGDDKRGAQANEGINGSVFIDELHVFDREMHERTKGAGIARKEPLNLAVSTAGDDPSTYGFERVEYGRKVNAGQIEDLHFLHVEYSAPQKATDADIADHLDEYGRMANPAWGTLVMPSEFRQDYETSKDTPRSMARFKQYRLDIWVGSMNPWLNESHWAANKEDYQLSAMGGRDAKMGIDLSRTRDMTSAVLTFPFPEDGESGEVVKIWPMFWIPRKIAEARKNLFPFLEWAEAGWLTLTDGNVVDYTKVEDDIVEAIEINDITVTDIFFDQHYAEEITQRLCARLNCNRTAVSQTLMALTALCKEMERRIDSGKLKHPGNPVMDWQIGHVQTISDRNQNIRPVKPDSNTGKCIDGVMALVDTFAGVVEDEAGSGSSILSFT